MTIKYTLSEKTVKQHLGPAYRPMSYKLGEDYIERKCFRSFKRIYRSDLLDGTLPGEVAEQSAPEPQADVPAQVEAPHVTEPVQSGVSVEQKIVRLYPNRRWVQTDKEEQVFVGLKGLNLKCGQIIRVKNKTLCIR
jgi:hypothetical protein